jgi:hypothetical protein
MLSYAAKRGYNQGLSGLSIQGWPKKLFKGSVVFAGCFTIFC